MRRRRRRRAPIASIAKALRSFVSILHSSVATPPSEKKKAHGGLRAMRLLGRASNRLRAV